MMIGSEIFPGKPWLFVMGKPWENPRKMVVLWDFMGFTTNIAMEKFVTFNGKNHYELAIFNSYVKLLEGTIW